MIGKKKEKYFVIWFMKEENGYSRLRRQKVKPNTQFVKMGESKHEINMQYPTWRKGSTRFYLVELKEGQLYFNPKEIDYDPELLHDILDRKIIQQLASNLTSQQWKINIFLAIFSAIFGGLIGFIIAGGNLG